MNNAEFTGVRAIVARYHPEVRVSGYTSSDGTIEFYNRIRSLLKPDMHVLDFGAGRGAWVEEDPCEYSRQTRTIRGSVARYVGCDVDPAILQNPSLDEGILLEIGKPLPFADHEFDVIVSDYTFEHLAAPREIAAELARVLKPGGWICARTPNKYGYISVLARLAGNASHSRILRFAQPGRKEQDVFPTVFRMNSMRALRACFPSTVFEHLTYRYEAEPAYFFNSRAVFRLMSAVNRVLPRVFSSTLLVFLRKK